MVKKHTPPKKPKKYCAVSYIPVVLVGKYTVLMKRYAKTSTLIRKCTALGIAKFVQVGLTC